MGAAEGDVVSQALPLQRKMNFSSRKLDGCCGIAFVGAPLVLSSVVDWYDSLAGKLHSASEYFYLSPTP